MTLVADMTWVWVALAGGLGALARYELGGVVLRRTGGTRPWGTVVVNLVGSLALGVVVGLGRRQAMSPQSVEVIAIGFLGGFTTFSTWMVETLDLVDADRPLWSAAAVNIAVVVVGGIAGFGLGLALAG